MDLQDYLKAKGDEMKMSQNSISSPEQLDQQIDKNIQQREIEKLKVMFYDQLKNYYSNRKYQEEISITCASKCLRGFHEEDLERAEKACLNKCFHKYYRFLMYSSSVYQFLAQEEGKDEFDSQSPDTLKLQHLQNATCVYLIRKIAQA